jgi:tRNA pseudouridine55 synthase
MPSGRRRIEVVGIAPRRTVHGVLLLDKPLGWTSSDAVLAAKRLFRADKAGHTGTLDPLATGLLPICFGAATKFSQISLDADKRYRATLHLGVRTTTGDREGAVIEERAVALRRAQIDAVLARFTGPLAQLPPMHSALKKAGRALYDYARDGIEVDREPRQVTIHRLDLVDWRAEELTLDVHCSKGTYIRTLAEDIGGALGCGAHLAALRRTACAALQLDGAIAWPALQALAEPERDALLLPPDVLLADWPRVDLGADAAARLLCGQRQRVALADAAAVRVYGPAPGGFLGSAHVRGGELIPDRLLGPDQVAALAGIGSGREPVAPIPETMP